MIAIAERKVWKSQVENVIDYLKSIRLFNVLFTMIYNKEIQILTTQ